MGVPYAAYEKNKCAFKNLGAGNYVISLVISIFPCVIKRQRFLKVVVLKKLRTNWFFKTNRLIMGTQSTRLGN